jgi:hypothetical protein
VQQARNQCQQEQIFAGIKPTAVFNIIVYLWSGRKTRRSTHGIAIVFSTTVFEHADTVGPLFEEKKVPRALAHAQSDA